jgi:amidase
MSASNVHDPHPPSAEVASLGAVALRRALEAGELTSVEVVESLIGRIEAVDRDGPELRSVLSVAGDAVALAAERDAERRSGALRGPLHGLPVLVKDNIDTAGDLGTTAGSLALAGSGPSADARLVGLLRGAGAIILGKTNLTEWANFRGRPSSSGWSGVGRQTRNPHGLNRTPGGSSSGSGAGVASGLSPLAVGTETDGSIICPAAACGIVGLKPTVGLVSRSGIVPISFSQDTAGPMGRSVADVALLLDALASGAVDPADAATADPSRQRPDGGYLAALTQAGDAAGLRVGVVRDDGYFGFHPGVDAAIESVLPALVAAGIEVVDPVREVGKWTHDDEMTVLCHEFRATLDAYLSARAAAATSGVWLPRSLQDVIEFNERTPREELGVFNQEVLIRSAATSGLDEPAYLSARAANHRRTREDGIDAVCGRERLDALVAPSMSPAWPIDHVNGDTHSGSSWSHAAIAGYPSVTVPVGSVHGLPVGLTIWGQAWSEATILRIAAALQSQLSLTFSPRYAESVAIIA